MAPRVGLALSGGGAKGAFTVGVLKVVRQKLGVTRFPVISGTSTGSLVGTLLAIDDWSTLVDVYSNVTTESIVNPHHALVASIAGPEAVLFAAAVLGGRAIYDTAALRATIQANVDMKDVVDAYPGTLLIYNTVDLQTGLSVAFSNKDHGKAVLLDALMASASMPVLMDPVEITVAGRTHQYVDGGVREFLPLGAVFASDVPVDQIIAISTAPLAARKRSGDYDKITEILGRTVDLMDVEVGANDYSGARLYNAILKMIENGAANGVAKAALLRGIPDEVKSSIADKVSIPITIIAPADHLAIDALDFDPPKMRAAMALGVEAAKQVF